MALNWGIVSAGKISHDFVTALSTLSTVDHKVVAVAARNLIDAQKFANIHDIPIAYQGYKSLAQDPNVEVVYIGALNPQHYEIVMLMLSYGKHVLCEKPLCMNEWQAQKLIDYARSKKLFLMEAIWSRFFPSYQYVRKQIQSGVLGDIQKVVATFGYDHSNNDRLMKKSLGGGTVLDLGVYAIQVCQWVFEDKPIKITANSSQLNNDGVDIKMKATLNYKNGGVAEIETSSLGFLDNVAKIIGTKGEITINQFWSSTSIIDVDGNEKTWTLPDARIPYNYPNGSGLGYEANEVWHCIRGGLLESNHLTHNESLIIAQIEDEIRRQIGVKYDADNYST